MGWLAYTRISRGTPALSGWPASKREGGLMRKWNVFVAALWLLVCSVSVSAQVNPLGPNEIAVGKAYKLSFDQTNPANITHWQIYGQRTGQAQRQALGPKIPFSALVAGQSVTVDLPAEIAKTKISLTVDAVNDPEPGVVAAAWTTSTVPLVLDVVQPTATKPDAPTNLRKARLDPVFNEAGEFIGVTLTVLTGE